MIRDKWQSFKQILSTLFHIPPELKSFFSSIKAELTIYRARRRTANFNSVLMWREIVGGRGK